MKDTIGVKNPMRYKGYYYDSETQMYYCKSRYYNPDFCRWISGDSEKYIDTETPLVLNLFLNRNNDPIMYYDSAGHSAESILKIIGSIALIVGLGIFTYVSAGATSGLLAVAAPIIRGAFWGATAGAITGGITGAISGAFSYFQFSTSFLNKINPNIRFLPEIINIGIQTLGNGAISMASSLLSGNSIGAAKMAFFFGVSGGNMGANVAGQLAKSVWRSGMDSLGLSASEYLVTKWLGV